MKNPLKFFVACGLLFAASQLLGGCATVPAKGALPVYNIGGAAYYPLVSLCGARNIDWQYDTFTRTATLSKGLHKIALRAGDAFALVDGRPFHLRHPAVLYQGAILVPAKFKEQVIDTLFKEGYPAPQLALPLSRIKKIVIDAGHGGGDPGAIGRTGLREKDVNLDISKRLRALLRARGVEVVMTRSTDKFIPLSSRAAIANGCQADLFLSIHSNANRLRSLNGFEIYYIAGGANDSKRAYAAAMAAAPDLDSACFIGNSPDLKATLWDMIYTSNRAESIELARFICRAIDSNLEVRVLGIKGASFQVLREVRIPAILVEVGFLSNGREELMLKNNYYRQKIAESLTQGIENYARDLMLAEAAR